MKGISLWCALDPVRLAWWQLAFIAEDRQDLILSPRVLLSRRLRGLSRVLGNSHARFLGGRGAEMRPSYPASCREKILDSRLAIVHNGYKTKPTWRCFVNTFTVKNIPPNIYEKLKRSAKLNRRSINSEIIVCIEKTVNSQAIDPEIVLTKARDLRSLTQAVPITDGEFTQAKATGRS